MSLASFWKRLVILAVAICVFVLGSRHLKLGCFEVFLGVDIRFLSLLGGCSDPSLLLLF